MEIEEAPAASFAETPPSLPDLASLAPPETTEARRQAAMTAAAVIARYLRRHSGLTEAQARDAAHYYQRTAGGDRAALPARMQALYANIDRNMAMPFRIMRNYMSFYQPFAHTLLPAGQPVAVCGGVIMGNGQTSDTRGISLFCVACTDALVFAGGAIVLDANAGHAHGVLLAWTVDNLLCPVAKYVGSSQRLLQDGDMAQLLHHGLTHLCVSRDLQYLALRNAAGFVAVREFVRSGGATWNPRAVPFFTPTSILVDVVSGATATGTPQPHVLQYTNHRTTQSLLHLHETTILVKASRTVTGCRLLAPPVVNDAAASPGRRAAEAASRRLGDFVTARAIVYTTAQDAGVMLLPLPAGQLPRGVLALPPAVVLPTSAPPTQLATGGNRMLALVGEDIWLWEWRRPCTPADPSLSHYVSGKYVLVPGVCAHLYLAATGALWSAQIANRIHVWEE